MPRSLHVRFAVPEDRGAIEAICLQEYEQLRARFDEIAPVKLIEQALMAVVVTDDADANNIMACAMFNDTPPATDLQAQPWFDALKPHTADGAELSALNTLWLTFFVSDPEVAEEAADMLFQSTFSTLPDTEWIVYPQPVGVASFEPLQSVFTALNPAAVGASCAEEEGVDAWGGSSSPSTAAFLALSRDKYVAPLKVRNASVEDCDDLTAPLEAQSVNLEAMFGSQYFVAELIRSASDDTRVFAAETKQVDAEGVESERALGIMSVSSVVEPGMIKSLQQSFDLRPYGGLVKVVDAAETSLASASAAASASQTEEELAAADAAIVAITPVAWAPLLNAHLPALSALLEKWAEKVAISAGVDIGKLKAAKRAALLDGEVPVDALQSKLCAELAKAGVVADTALRAVAPLVAFVAARAERARAAQRALGAAMAAEGGAEAEAKEDEVKEAEAKEAEAKEADTDASLDAAAADEDAPVAAPKKEKLMTSLRSVLLAIAEAPQRARFCRWLRQHTKAELLRTVGRAFSLEDAITPATLAQVRENPYYRFILCESFSQNDTVPLTPLYSHSTSA